MSAAIELQNISFTYDNKKEQIQNVNLNISAGEAVLITGPSGSGKTTLTRVINGLIPHFFEGELSGELLINGQNSANLEIWEQGEQIGNVFQDPRSQFFSSEVAGEIAFSCENYGLSHDKIRNRVTDSALKTGITPLLSRKLTNLSYGERQKVAIASAYAIHPDIYVMDEPSANLDMDATAQLSQLLRSLKQQGSTLVIAEHRLYYLMDIVDRIIYMEHGKIHYEFTPAQLKQLSQAQIREFGLRTPHLAQLIPSYQYIHRETKTLIQAKQISVILGRTSILNGINININAGEVIAMIGHNGAGKSTIGKVLSGIIREKTGQIQIHNISVKFSKRRKDIWYIMQDLDSQLFSESVLDELLLGDVSKQDHEKANDILQNLGLSSLKDQHPQCLSGGQKQRLALGVALMRDTCLLILDEPTSGLDGASMLQVASLIRNLASEGRAMLIITHDYEFIMNACDRIIQIESGKVAADFPITTETDILSLMMEKTDDL